MSGVLQLNRTHRAKTIFRASQIPSVLDVGSALGLVQFFRVLF